MGVWGVSQQREGDMISVPQINIVLNINLDLHICVCFKNGMGQAELPSIGSFPRALVTRARLEQGKVVVSKTNM